MSNKKEKSEKERLVFYTKEGEIIQIISVCLLALFLFVVLYVSKHFSNVMLLPICITVLFVCQLLIYAQQQLVIDAKGIRIRLHRKETWHNIEKWEIDAKEQIIHIILNNGEKRTFGKLKQENIVELRDFLALMSERKQ